MPRRTPKPKALAPSQLNFNDIQSLSFLDNLSILQRKIAILLREQIPQAEIARKLNKSRSYIGQTVRLFLDNNLIKPLSTTHKTDGRRHYNQFFELSTALQKKLSQDTTPPISPIRTHHIIRKFSIVRQSRDISKDKRTGYSKSWTMRGGERHKYWYPGKAGEVSITIDVHPKTLVAYIDAGQKIIAETCVQAEDRGIQMVRDCVRSFVETQQLFGVRMEIDEIGQQVGKTHFGVVAHKASKLYGNGQTTLPESWIDASVASELEPDKFEWETTKPEYLTPFEKGMRDIALVDNRVKEGVTAAMPEAMQEFNKQFTGLNESISQVAAMVQGGITMQQQYAQMQHFMTKVLDEMQAVRKELLEVKRENEELKRRSTG